MNEASWLQAYCTRGWENARPASRRVLNARPAARYRLAARAPRGLRIRLDLVGGAPATLRLEPVEEPRDEVALRLRDLRRGGAADRRGAHTELPFS